MPPDAKRGFTRAVRYIIYHMKHWPHAPARMATGPGLYIVTASTLRKQKLFNSDEKLDMLEEILLSCLQEGGFSLQAWAVFPNHYHIVGAIEKSDFNFGKVLGKVHGNSSRQLNALDGTAGRKVWFNFRDRHLTYEKAYLARLAYVHLNPVKHGLVSNAEDYRWCSARWFRLHADPPWYETVMSFKTDLVNEEDDF